MRLANAALPFLFLSTSTIGLAADEVFYNPDKAPATGEKWEFVTYSDLAAVADLSQVPESTNESPTWVWYDARKLHPTQFCEGYREVFFKREQFNTFGTGTQGDGTTPDSLRNKDNLYNRLARKDMPFVIGPDGTIYLQDGHHTMAGLISSAVDAPGRNGRKIGLGHIAANFMSSLHGVTAEARQAEFVKYPSTYGNSYLYGAQGNGLTGTPAAMPVEKLPTAVYSDDPATRMVDDPYRSLTWAMKYKEGERVGGYVGVHGVNFIEFRWGDLLRDKVIWRDVDNTNDVAFYVAVTNADALAHSPAISERFDALLEANPRTESLSARSFGYTAATAADSYVLTITPESFIAGDIVPSAVSSNTLNAVVPDGQTLAIDGAMANLKAVNINAAENTVTIAGGDLDGRSVSIHGGHGKLLLNGKNDYTGLTALYQGTLGGHGLIAGDLQVAAGAKVEGESPEKPLTLGGKVSGCGTYENVVFTGTLAGQGVETLRNCAMGHDGTMVVTLAETGLPPQSAYTVTGTFTEDGTLVIDAAKSKPAHGQKIEVLHISDGRLAGSFAHVVTRNMGDCAATISDGVVTITGHAGR